MPRSELANADKLIREFRENGGRGSVPASRGRDAKGSVTLEIGKNDAIFLTDAVLPKQVEEGEAKQPELQEITQCIRDHGTIHWLVKLKGVTDPVEMTHAEVLKLNRRMLLDFASDLIAKVERPRKS